MIKNAIVRKPASSLVSGLTTSALGTPDYSLALIQHQNYINALQQCGVEVTVLEAIEAYPDSCFVEDVALLTEHMALLTRPGALSRQGEVGEIGPIIRTFYKNKCHYITEPATLEAGDVLRVNNHFFIGLSARTNMWGAEQMTDVIIEHGFTASTIQLFDFLHLKTGLSSLENDYILVAGELIDHPQLDHFKQIKIDPSEAYAANCIMVNGTLLMPKDHPKTKKSISELGIPIIELDLSEFRKIDGGLSCLSLRF